MEGGKVTAERIGSIFWLGIGLFTIFGSFQVEVGTLREPGSGFVPLLAGSFICLLALIVFFRSFRGRGGIQAKLSTLWEGVEWRRPIVIGVVMIAYILALKKGGFLVTSFLLLFVILKGTEKYSWKKAFLISALASTFTFLLLGVALKATLPRGIFGF
jgi:putative tricarboxylic transport membrane protein